MSASKFCRNFLTFPQMGARENSYHTIGEKQHRNNDPKIQKTQENTALHANTEEQEQLDVPLVLVYFPETSKNHIDYPLGESTVQKKTQNIIISEHRLSTALQKVDSADKGKGLSLIMGHRCIVGEKAINCSSDVAVGGVLRPSSRRATNDHGTSSSLRGHVECTFTLKLPPGSTLVSDRGVFHTRNKERPFACGFCDKNYKRKKDVYKHIKQKHDEKHVMSHADCAGRDKGLSVIMGPRCNIEQKDTNCGSDVVVGGVLRPSSRRETNDHGTSSALDGHVESMVTLKHPPGSTLVSDRGMYRIKDKEKPFACAYCGEAYKRKKAAYTHISMQHDEKRYSCGFCGKRFGDQYHLSQHVTIHTREKPFACDECDKRIRLKDKLDRLKFTHAKKKRFHCKICNKSYTFKRDLFSHSEVHMEEECREGVIFNFCKKEFSLHSNLKEQMKIHTGEKPFKCSLCDKHFLVDIDLQHHMITHNKDGKLLLGDANDPEESQINLPVQLATSQGKARYIECDSKTGEMITQEPILSSNYCEQLPDITGLVESNILPCQLEDSQIQTKPLLPTAPGGLAITESNSTLRCTNSRLVSSLKGSSENVYNEVVSESKVAIVGEPRTSNTAKTKSNQSQGKGYRTKATNAKRISIASGIVYEDEVSSPESSRCSTTEQTLLSSLNSEEVPAPSSRQANNIHIKSFSGFRYAQSIVPSKVPPGSTLVSDRGIFRIKNKEKPFACGYCGKSFNKKKPVYLHIRYQHDEKRYSCEFCGKKYRDLSFLEQHIRMHTKEEPFTCDQCGKRFRFENSLCSHKYTHSEERLFPCNKCSKSFKTSKVLSRHKESHNKDEQKEGVICNICKRKFRNPCFFKSHMMIHTGEKPFKCSLCDKQFRLKMQLRNHVDSHNGKRRLANKPCSVCGKTVWANYMSTHMRMHTGEKPFECNICGKRFPKKTNLEGHIRSHTGEKPFACGGCDKRFALYSNMMTHKAKCNSDNVT